MQKKHMAYLNENSKQNKMARLNNGIYQVRYDHVIRYEIWDAIFNVRSKADMSHLNLPHGVVVLLL